MLRLIGIIRHLGSSTGSGHYVTYLKTNHKWDYFNDSKHHEVEENEGVVLNGTLGTPTLLFYQNVTYSSPPKVVTNHTLARRIPVQKEKPVVSPVDKPQQQSAQKEKPVVSPANKSQQSVQKETNFTYKVHSPYHPEKPEPTPNTKLQQQIRRQLQQTKMLIQLQKQQNRLQSILSDLTLLQEETQDFSELQSQILQQHRECEEQELSLTQDLKQELRNLVPSPPNHNQDMENLKKRKSPRMSGGGSESSNSSEEKKKKKLSFS